MERRPEGQDLALKAKILARVICSKLEDGSEEILEEVEDAAQKAEQSGKLPIEIAAARIKVLLKHELVSIYDVRTWFNEQVAELAQKV